MSFFDQPYYRLNKLFMTHVGIWPEQSLLARCLIPPFYILIICSIAIFEVKTVANVWRNPNELLNGLPPLFIVAISFSKLLNGSFNVKKYRALLNRMKDHWMRMGNSPNIEILHKYGRRARLFTILYAGFIYGIMSTYLTLPLLPIMLDIVAPLNETRPKKLLFELQYGVDQEKYFYPMFFHGVVTAVASIAILVTVDCMYFTIVGHACALFEMVGANMKTSKSILGNSSVNDHKRICYCVDLHTEALKFANIIESTFTTSFMFVLSASLLAMTMSALQLLLNSDNADDVVRYGAFMVGQVIHLFFNSIPGQRIIDYSLGVRYSIYESDWNNCHMKNKKLILMIMMRSQKPCILTAGKLYVLSVASFSSVMQTSMSYFTVISSML